MADVVVTVPKARWSDWIAEGDLPNERWSGYESHFWVSSIPNIKAGERVYIVAHGKLRGYAPLVRIESSCVLNPRMSCLVRRGGAVAITIPEPIRGFQGWRYRWWKLEDEIAFPNWRHHDT